ncbi:MAG: MmcB family DNA repair protein [Roseobacter sp.]
MIGSTLQNNSPGLSPGQKLARGTARLLRDLGLETLEEYVPEKGLRVDLIALGSKSEIWIVECKSSRADFMTDQKWQSYTDWCDRYFWAVDSDFPTDLLPQASGLIIADEYDAEIVRMPAEAKLNAARRKKIVHGFARVAARRLLDLRDPAMRG